MKFSNLLNENDIEYKKAKAEIDKLEKEANRYAEINRKKYPRDDRYITLHSNEVLQSKEYKQDRLNFQKAFKKLQDANKIFVKKFKKEISKEYYDSLK